MQRTVCQRGHLEDDPLWNAQPVKADQCIGDVFGSPHVEDEPGCSILNGLQTLDETGRQVDQQAVAIVQPTENKCKGFVWFGWLLDISPTGRFPDRIFP